ncbi:signal peptidase I [Streptomyces sp. SID8379]|uniref:signal peptidase I n=1 Tax=unclassified Streptomyces TaxID=2593676 RepID=UPI000996951D|nr:MULTISPECIES: signal peptidase I [unclassified Streptomyces]MYW68798.1 signal peptidase I [Streptomyces sp. SID8379]
MSQRRAVRGWRVVAWGLTPLGVVLLAGSVAYGLVRYETVTVASDSMRPGFPPGTRALVERIDAGGIHRGDVVLMDPPERYMSDGVLRRVIGVGGDHVTGSGNRVTVNGRTLDEPYVADEGDPRVGPYDVRVPSGRLFVLGDHRANANDSRYHLEVHEGSFAASGVRGRVVEGAAVPVRPALFAGLGIVLGAVGLAAGRRRTAPGPR